MRVCDCISKTYILISKAGNVNAIVCLSPSDAVGEIQLIVHGTWRHPYPESIAHHQTEASCRHIDMVDLFTSSMFKRAPFRFVKNVEDVLRYSNKSSPKGNPI